MKKTLGGERLGTGAKIKVDLHGWGRSTFNQSKVWRSTMGVGMGVPCYKNIGLNGTTFEIDIETLGHTIPAVAPCFGDFKLQIDLFACPIRLYQGLLHNNAVNIGLEMSQVLLPKLTLSKNAGKVGRTNTSSLLNYLNIRGCTRETRDFNATAILAYYDIFKCYYSNKQEENAKVIKWGEYEIPYEIENINIKKFSDSSYDANITLIKTPATTYDYTFSQTITISENDVLTIKPINNTKFGNKLTFNIQGSGTTIFGTQDNISNDDKVFIGTLKWNNKNIGDWRITDDGSLYIKFWNNDLDVEELGNYNYMAIYNDNEQIGIEDFPLKNIDEARRKILQKSGLMEQITINEDLNFLPYSINLEEDNYEMHKKEMQGLWLKTYLSDKFNNWLSNENVELINEISSVTTDSEGNFSMDALILAKKVYNLLNRIAVSGGTYEDWQESVYGQKAISRAESPIYIGGTSAMIQFEEVVSTATTEGEPLGSLGGRGKMTKRKGGKIVYKCNEPTIILGIASITPRIDYYQGNDWFATEINSMDDFHKPELDGIGFQNLIANQVVWSESRNKALAKQTAWLNYQTEINEVYGYFAEPESDDKYKSLGHMVLRRDYETDDNGEITDFTAYIDPEKYNKIFASQELTSQNFWIQIGFNCKVRRVMAACEIPNL